MNDELYREVKTLAAQENRQIAEVVERALSDYVQRSKRKDPLKSGLSRFLEAPPFKLTDEQFRESMELDFFDQ